MAFRKQHLLEDFSLDLYRLNLKEKHIALFFSTIDNTNLIHLAYLTLCLTISSKGLQENLTYIF